MRRALRTAAFAALTFGFLAATAEARRPAPRRSGSPSLRSLRLLQHSLAHPQRQQRVAPSAMAGINPLKPPVELLPNVSVLTNSAHQNAPAKLRYSVATFNVENLFAFRRNSAPSSEREARYLPKNVEQYHTKLARVAQTILSPMGQPEIVAVQEIENRAGVNVLGDLVAEIKRQSARSGRAVDYGYALSSGRADERGISQGFLYRKDRVQPLAGQPESHDTTVTAQISRDGVGGSLMRRPLLVGGFKIFRDGVLAGGPVEQVFVANQHLKSRPEEFIERRQAQAKFTGDLVAGLLRHDRKRVIVAGDFNADLNQPAHRNQIGGLERLDQQGLLANLTAKLGQGERFSYRYKGRPQLLDWMYASAPLSQQLVELRIPHVNSTKTRDQRASDHDPVIATFAGAFTE